MYVEKHWVRNSTLSEKRMCRRKTFFYFLIFVSMLIITIKLCAVRPEPTLDPVVICFGLFTVYAFVMFLDGGSVLCGDTVCVNSKEDYSAKDKWYYYFIPHSPSGQTVGCLVLLYLFIAAGSLVCGLIIVSLK